MITAPFNVASIDFVTNSDGTFDASNATDSLRVARDARDDARRLIQRADACYIGALIGSAFRQNPTLDEFTLDITAESQIGDEGRSYTSAFVEAVDVNGSDASLNDQLLANLETHFEDEGYDLYQVLMMNAAGDEDPESESSFTFKRSDITHALEAENISGAAVFAAALPALSHMLDPDFKVLKLSESASAPASPIDEDSLAAWLSQQLEDGHMSLEDVPRLMARYALAQPKDMINEFAERMELSDVSAPRDRPSN